MLAKQRVAQYVTKQNLTKAFGAFEGKMNRRFDRLEGSIENLAQAVQRGFEESHQKIETLQVDVGELKGDVKQLKGDVRCIDYRLARQQDLLDENRTGLAALTGRIGQVESTMGSI